MTDARPPAAQPSADQAATDQAATDQAATDQAATDQAATDQAATDQAATDQAATDRPAGAHPAPAGQSDNARTDRPTRAGGGSRPSRTDSRPTGVRPLGRARGRRRAGPLHKVAMVVFTVGLVAILVDATLFASGIRDMPWWLHVLTILAPLGLGIGLIGTVTEARRDSG